MTTNFNSEVTKKIVEGLKLQASAEPFPSRVGDVILPVFISNPDRKIQFAETDASDSVSATIHTTSLTKDTYLVAVYISTAKDVNATATHSRIEVTPDTSPAKNIFRINFEPLTAGQFSEHISYQIPIKLRKGTTITIRNSTAIASIDSTGGVYFYEVEGEE